MLHHLCEEREEGREGGRGKGERTKERERTMERERTKERERAKERERVREEGSDTRL